MAEDANPRAVTEIDRFIGRQIRIRRANAGLSQEALSEAVGVTFQQVQKYEKGVNRVAASTLYRIAQALGVEASVLMPSVSTAGDATAAADAETIAALALPLSRLNADGREVLLVLARALGSHTTLKA